MTLRRGTRLHILETELPAAVEGAGTARRAAVAYAARLAGPDGIVLTTDADGRVDPSWLRQTLVAVGAGADAVAGFVSLDPVDERRLPAQLIEDDRRECVYDDLLDALSNELDPEPADPAPRHTHASGASLAVRVGALERAGGVPALASGEDRALVGALARIDARIRHSLAVRVTVSGRIAGRATGGMADTIARRLAAPDLYIDDRLIPAEDAVRRARLRRTLRRAWQRSGDLPCRINPELGWIARRAGVPASRLTAHICNAQYFGALWEAVERESPALRRRPVAVSALERETARARVLLEQLRNRPPRLHATPGENGSACTSLLS